MLYDVRLPTVNLKSPFNSKNKRGKNLSRKMAILSDKEKHITGDSNCKYSASNKSKIVKTL